MSEFNFDSLIAPILAERFFSEFWETKPLRISRKQCDYYAPLVSGDDIDYMLTVACLLDRGGVDVIHDSKIAKEQTKGLRQPVNKLNGSARPSKIGDLNLIGNRPGNHSSRLTEL